jgi:hypothetical protein
MKTVVPRVANAKLSCRLVPNMSPDDIAAKVKAHLESKGAELLANVMVKVSGFRSYPWTSPRDTPGGCITQSQWWLLLVCDSNTDTLWAVAAGSTLLAPWQFYSMHASRIHAKLSVSELLAVGSCES